MNHCYWFPADRSLQILSYECDKLFFKDEKLNKTKIGISRT